MRLQLGANMRHMLTMLAVVASTLPGLAAGHSCAGKIEEAVGGVARVLALSGGGLAAFSKMNVNLDGFAHAYHPNNYAGGALLHLCNAGKVFLADGTSYQGSESNATCTGRFMADFARIGKAGWDDSATGAINWYGILGEGSAKVGGKAIHDVKPILQKDGSGFYVSPTSLIDKSVADPGDQDRYVNPLRVPSAVVPGSLAARGIVMGTFGVAIDTRMGIAVPFVVGDGGPAIGEGSAALARLVAGKLLDDHITHKESAVGQVDGKTVLWIFFGGFPTTFHHDHEDWLSSQAKEALAAWGGEARLKDCLATVPNN